MNRIQFTVLATLIIFLVSLGGCIVENQGAIAAEPVPPSINGTEFVQIVTPGAIVESTNYVFKNDTHPGEHEASISWYWKTNDKVAGAELLRDGGYYSKESILLVWKNRYLFQYKIVGN